MSRITAAFVCALDDPNNARPASIMCSNNCGRYVCAEHAVERKGPGSPMLCLVCAKALGVLPVQPKAEVKPITPKTEPIPAPFVPAAEPRKADKSEIERLDFTPMAEAKPVISPTPKRPDPDSTARGQAFTPPANEEATAPLNSIGAAVPINEQKIAPSMIEPETEPKSAASETIVSQRGNTLQVPKVTATSPRTGNTGQLPKIRTGQTGQVPPVRIAQRATESKGSSLLQNQAILWAIGAIVLGIIGFVMIVAALNGG